MALGGLRKLFVANRGEIALRIFRAAGELGLNGIDAVVQRNLDRSERIFWKVSRGTAMTDYDHGCSLRVAVAT